MKKKPRKYDFGECEICDGKMVEKRIKQDFWIGGKLIVVDNVPAGVCSQLHIPMKSPPIVKQTGTHCGANRQSEKSERSDAGILFIT
jgi:YgiT-type zinc finger domain-containing protein